MALTAHLAWPGSSSALVRPDLGTFAAVRLSEETSTPTSTSTSAFESFHAFYSKAASRGAGGRRGAQQLSKGLPATATARAFAARERGPRLVAPANPRAVDVRRSTFDVRSFSRDSQKNSRAAETALLNPPILPAAVLAVRPLNVLKHLHLRLLFWCVSSVRRAPSRRTSPACGLPRRVLPALRRPTSTFDAGRYTGTQWSLHRQ